MMDNDYNHDKHITVTLENGITVCDCGKFFLKNDENYSELKVCYPSQGYASVSVYTGKGKSKNYLAHRLMAMAFIPKKEGKLLVNHIDGNKQNYNLDNLEWVDQRENILHAVRTGLLNPYKNHKNCPKCGKFALFKNELCRDCEYEFFNKAYKQKKLDRIRASVIKIDKDKLNKNEKIAYEMRYSGKSFVDIGFTLGITSVKVKKLFLGLEGYENIDLRR